MNPHLRDRIHGFISDSLPEEDLHALLDAVENDPEVALELAEALDLQGKLRAAAYVRSGAANRTNEKIIQAVRAPRYGARIAGALRPRRSPIRIILPAVLAAALAIAGALWLRHDSDRTIGVIASAGVGIDLDRGGALRPVVAGDKLRHGDQLIASAPTESVEVRLADGSRIRTVGAANVSFRKVGLGKHLHVFSGIIDADVRPQPAGHPLVITSAIARATVVGTRLAFNAQPEFTRLDVRDGAVEFVNQAEDRIMVESGQYAIARVNHEKLQASERRIAPQPAAVEGYARWQHYAKLIEDDPSVIAWYDFQDDNQRGILPVRQFNYGGDLGNSGNADGRIYDAAWSDGRFPGLKKSLLFQDRAFVDCGRDKALLTHGPFTILVWCRVLAFTEPFNTIVTTGYEGWGFQRNRGQSSLEFFYFANGSYQNAVGKIPIGDGGWHCVAATFDGHQTSLYVDGVLDAQRVIRGERQVVRDPLLISANLDPNGNLCRYFQGWIDEVILFSRALPQEEIRALHEAGSPIP